MTQIIAICGRMQSGKTTSSNYIHGLLLKQNLVVEDFRINELGKLVVTSLFKQEDGSYKKDMGVLDLDQKTSEFEYYAASNIWPIVKSYSFADALKEVCIGLLGLTWEQCYGSNDDKNTLTELRWENMPGVISTVLEDKDGNTSEDYGFKYHKSGNMTAREVLQFVGTEIFRKMKNDVWVSAVLNQIEVEGSSVAVIPDCRYLNEVEAVKARGGLAVRLLRDPIKNNHDSEKDLDSFSDFDLVIDNTNLTIKESNLELLKFLLEKKIVKPTL